MKHFIPFCAFCLALLGSFSLSAREVSREDATSYAVSFFSTRGTTRADARVKEVRLPSTRSGGDPGFYIFNNASGNGFVIISADDASRAVLAYSFDSHFSAEKMPANLSEWLSSLSMEIDFIRKSGANRSSFVINDWGSLKAGSYSSHKPVVLHTTALWNQGDPFNRLTPADNDQHAVTGCVQTAIAIFMKYSHDREGVECRTLKEITRDYTVEWPAKGTKKQGTIPAGRVYQWDRMRMDNYSSADATEEEKMAVSQLMADLGIMQGAEYSLGGTGAVSTSISRNMIELFGYDSDARCLFRDGYNKDQWCALLRRELDRRPVIYSGSPSYGAGHCFILDGYAKYDFFHINWGWGGMSNGYFAIDAFAPEKQGIGGSNGAGYVFYQNAQFGLQQEDGIVEPYGDSESSISIENLVFENTPDIVKSNTDYSVRMNSLKVLGSEDVTITRYFTRKSAVDVSDAPYKRELGRFTFRANSIYSMISSGWWTDRVCLGDCFTLMYQIQDSDSIKEVSYFHMDDVRGELPLIDAAFIIANESYKAGDVFKKQIFYGRDMPRYVGWYCDGKQMAGDIILTSGKHVIKARLDYGMEGCYETLTREIIVE